MYVNNQKKKAKLYLEKLKQRQPNNSALRKPLERYVMEELTEDLDSMNEDQARYAINGFLNTSFQMFLYGDVVQAKTFWDLAKKINESYIARTKNRKGRMGVLPFPEMAVRYRDLYMKNFPAQAKAIEEFYNNMLGAPPSLLKKPE